MRVVLKGVPPALKSYIEEKLVRTIEKLFQKNGQNLPLLEIEFKQKSHHHRKGNIWRVEANLSFGKKMLRAEADGEKPYEAIDLLEEELQREVKQFKGRTREKERRGARTLKKRLRGGNI